MFVGTTRNLMVAGTVVMMGLLGASGAKAATASNNFDVTATIIASCTIAANNLAFGNYDPLNATAVNQQTTISVTCSNNAPYNVRLNGGSVAGNVAARAMGHTTSPSLTNRLNYSLFRDSARTLNWGETDTTDTFDDTGTGAAQTIPVYGTIPALQAGPAIGSYSDTVTATIRY